MQNNYTKRQKQVGLTRLSKLAQFLRTVPKENFDMYHFHLVSPCGTSACAAGWACEIPSFKHAGLHMCREGTGLPIYKDLEGLDAIGRFFYIGSHAYNLFGCFNRSLKKEVQLINNYVRRESRKLNK